MTASLLVLVPVALLVLISGFCFVGCALDTHGLGTGEPPPPTPFTKYSVDDVMPTAVAYWPLNEPSATAGNPVASAIAKDVVGNNDGNYTHKGNAPPGMFPCPGFPIASGIDSAFAIGSLALGVVSLLPGDAVQPGNDPNVLTTGMQVDGGFVTVPLNAVINPSVFTIEAWARPEWGAGAKAAFRAVIDSRFQGNGMYSGFAIWVSEAGNWEAQLGTTGGSVIVVTADAAQQAATHVVLRFDGTKAALFTNGVKTSPDVPLPMGTQFNRNTTAPLVIGVAFPWLTPRMQASDMFFFPLLPFNGTIQDVAIYDTVLSDDDILKHFNDGSGKTTVPAG